MYKKLALATVVASSALMAQTQSEAPEKKFAIKMPDMKIEPYAQLQGWAVYSMGREAETNGSPGMDNTDNRLNLFFRRARLGFRGNPYKNLSYVLSMYYDNAGHDSMGSTRASTLPSTNGDVVAQGGPATVGLWDSFLTWKLLDDSDMFHVTGGYFRPQISRESITAAFNVNSFEKAPSQNYVRQAVIGRGFGRGTGLNLGGLSQDKKFNYNVGVFNKVTTGDEFDNGTDTSTLGETQGARSNSLVYVGRAAYSFGDPEMAKYGLGYVINYFGKRKGLTLALNGSSQDATPRYKGNKVIGADFLFNHGGWTVDGEFFYIYKKNIGEADWSRSRTGHIRAGHDFFLTNGTVLEPAVMVSGFYGEDGADYTGRDVVVDVGLNWYLDQNRYKFYLHYVNQDGDGDNLVFNEKDPADGAGGYIYGDYVGLGLTLQI